jgi:membrane protease YdiL (CAAX protease family)
MSDEPEEGDGSAQRQMVVLLAVFVEGGMIVLALALGWLLGQSPLRQFRWDGRGVLWGAVGAGPPLVLGLLALRWPIGPLRRIKRFGEEVVRPLMAPCSLIDLVGISVLAGLGEEMLFRGVFQGAFSHWLHPWAALVLASVLFGVLHAVTFGYAVLAAIMGAYLGWLWTATDNLLVPAVTHALYDLVVLLFILRGPGSDLPPEEGEEESTEEEEAAESASQDVADRSEPRP